MSQVGKVLTCVAVAGSALMASSCSSPNGDEAAPEPEIVVTETVEPSTAPKTDQQTASDLYNTGSEDREVEIAGITKSITDPDSLWVLVNKHNPLPATYEPNDLITPDLPKTGDHNQLRAEAARALMEMSKAADVAVGKPLKLVSGYRSYADQKDIYDRYVAKDGRENADTYSARAGYSEHQTGLVVDLSTVNGKMEKFGDTKLGEWTAENAWKFGFILRFTPENTSIVGYQSEPWHFRYVGRDLAAYYHENHVLALEQLFDQPAAPNYQ